MFKGCVRGQHGVVWLDDGSRHLWGRVHRKFQLRLFPIISRQSLHEQGAEARTGSTTERVENKESLKTRAVVGETTDLLEDRVDQFFANGVVSSSVCALAADKLLDPQLLAASSLPVIIVSGWNKLR